ncbi:PHA/PHB synthase family protein [Melaminivora alkalimesophila]|uniref:Polyhydroxyalkanoate synthase n=1 Tax=Melaminivora alkalimesophila TaxID=1165852 RepID=A0A317R9J9_9BURK|nr:alpha/beta fold hydrolase [Melaminivora alkalimesophila]PWW45639.1 polyhydroxyalkanoate synthase [Melaminivora alkalimesophila]
MPSPIESITPREAQRQAARALDASTQTQLARLFGGLSPVALGLAHADWALHLMASPGRQAVLAQRAVELSLQAWRNLGVAAAPDAPTDTDARFAHEGWKQWPFNALKEGHKALDAWWREAAQQEEGVSRHHQHMVRFFTGQALDAVSPSNWAFTNPEVLHTARQTRGRSLQEGWQLYLKDLREQLGARPETPGEALEPLEYAVGRDVAATPGKVVFRNHLIELIRYSPSTDKVHPEPVLIVPSCIMKYYILDLSPHNSMVKYLVGQGHTVFIISWRNPDAEDRDLKMQDYLSTGVLAAMAAAKASSGAERLHTMGYCLGGTFLAIAAAALGRIARRRKGQRTAKEKALVPDDMPELASVILLAAQTDFSEPGELGVFIDEAQLATLRQAMHERGYLSGRQMGGSFQFLASRSLVWSRNTRRYLLGEDDASFDLMSWNADTTRLPARMHSEYLTALFLNNALASGQYRFAGSTVALMDIHVPMMVVATTRDHVSPWKSVYKIHLQTDTHVTFVLAEGGHNAGIVSEPGRPRRSYQVASVEDNSGWIDPDEWKAQTPVVPGSWWEAMQSWIRERSGKPIAAQPIPAAQALCDAPGTYVLTRYAD